MDQNKTSVTKPGTVDRRVRKTKKQLRQGLTQLLQTKNINEISVRELERLVKKINQEQKNGVRQVAQKVRIPYFQEVELALHEHLGRKVQVSGSEKKGSLQIEFYGQEDLAELIRLLHLDQ